MAYFQCADTEAECAVWFVEVAAGVVDDIPLGGLFWMVGNEIRQQGLREIAIAKLPASLLLKKAAPRT
jgi:hypothetical protein